MVNDGFLGCKSSGALRTTFPQEIAVIRRIHSCAARQQRSLAITFDGFRLGLAFVAALGALGGAHAVQADAPTGDTIDGIRCDRSEGAVFHIHQHVMLLDHGRSVPIPNDVGRPVLGECLYWIHTHSADGIVHVESPVFRSFTLGNFFDVWGQPLSATAAGPARFKKGALRAYVDGRRYSGDPRGIEMTLHADIVLEAGQPYHTPAPFTDWNGN